MVEVFNLTRQLIILLVEFFLLQTGELSETHIHNGTCLQFIEGKTFHQTFHSHLSVLAGFDDTHHFVNIVGSDDEPL